MYSELGIDKTSITFCQFQGNAIIERTNRTIEEALSNYVVENHNDWDKYLQIVLMAQSFSILMQIQKIVRTTRSLIALAACQRVACRKHPH